MKVNKTTVKGLIEILLNYDMDSTIHFYHEEEAAYFSSFEVSQAFGSVHFYPVCPSDEDE